MTQTPMLLKKFTKKTGVKSSTVRQRIHRGIWTLGAQCIKDPYSGEIYVIWERYLLWMEPNGSLLEELPTKEAVTDGKKKVPERRPGKKVNPHKV